MQSIQEKANATSWLELQRHIRQWLNASLQEKEILELSPDIIEQLSQKQFSVSTYLDQNGYHLSQSPLRHLTEGCEQQLYVSTEEDSPFLAIVRSYEGADDAKYRAFSIGSKNRLQQLSDNFPEKGLESFH